MEPSVAPKPLGSRLKLPREDGAWWMGLMCWLCGWAVSKRLTWEPLAVAAGVAALFASAGMMRAARRWWVPDRPAALRMLFGAMLGAIPGAGTFLLVLHRIDHAGWIGALSLPAIAYAPAIVTGMERRPFFRMLAVVALTAVAPVTYAVAARATGRTAALLWIALGGYFLLGSIFVMARFRKSAIALWMVRLASSALFAGALFAFIRGEVHWILSGAFLMLAIRAWIFRAGGAPIDPRRVGKTELMFGIATSLLVVAGFWLK